MLLTMHGVAAGAMRVPELVLDKSEADGLADALMRLEREYPTAVDPRILAWVNLAVVGGMIYGTRVMAIRMRLENERKGKRPARPQEGEVQSLPAKPVVNPPAGQGGAPGKPVGWPDEMPWPPGSVN